MSRRLRVAFMAMAASAILFAQNEQWTMKMDDAQDAKDTLQDAVGMKNAKDAGEATAKMIAILTETKTFWAGQKQHCCTAVTAQRNSVKTSKPSSEKGLKNNPFTVANNRNRFRGESV